MSETFAWTDERKAELERLWSKGCSGSDIARVLGCSRNAVLGMLHRRRLGNAPIKLRQLGRRLGKPWTKSDDQRLRALYANGHGAQAIADALGRTRWAVERRKAQLRIVTPRAERKAPLSLPRLRPAPARPKTPQPIPAGAPKPLMLSLLDLTEATCKWPIGHPREAGFGFCGHPKEFADTYCGYHARLAYTDPVRVVRSPKQAEEMA